MTNQIATPAIESVNLTDQQPVYETFNVQVLRAMSQRAVDAKETADKLVSQLVQHTRAAAAAGKNSYNFTYKVARCNHSEVNAVITKVLTQSGIPFALTRDPEQPEHFNIWSYTVSLDWSLADTRGRA